MYFSGVTPEIYETDTGLFPRVSRDPRARSPAHQQPREFWSILTQTHTVMTDVTFQITDTSLRDFLQVRNLGAMALRLQMIW